MLKQLRRLLIFCLVCKLEQVHDASSNILQVTKHYTLKHFHITDVSATGRLSFMVETLDFFGIIIDVLKHTALL